MYLRYSALATVYKLAVKPKLLGQFLSSFVAYFLPHRNTALVASSCFLYFVQIFRIGSVSVALFLSVSIGNSWFL